MVGICLWSCFGVIWGPESVCMCVPAVCIHRQVCAQVYVYIDICMSTIVNAYVCVYFQVCLSVCLHVCMSAYLHQFIIYLPIYVIYVYLSLCVYL